MEELIKALQLFLKYGNPKYPTHCEHDVLTVMIDPAVVSDDDKQKLEEMGFIADNEYGYFKSFRYGSC